MAQHPGCDYPYSMSRRCRSSKQPNPMPDTFDHIRYLPLPDTGEGWGIDLVDAGRQRVAPGASYPPRGHPPAYQFSWTEGRCLDEFQLLYLTSGKGVVESPASVLRELVAGDLLLLRPGQWHRYRPDSATGWTEQWIGFRGARASELVDYFLPGDSRVRRLGIDPQLLSCFETALAWMRSLGPGHRQVAATQIPEILALARARSLERDCRGNRLKDTLRRGQLILLNRMGEALAMPQVARELGMSYSLFRQRFREMTGFPPAAYLRQIRINRACELLHGTDRALAAIAETTGFGSVYHFSKAFKQATGQAPGAFRKQSRQRAYQSGSPSPVRAPIRA